VYLPIICPLTLPSNIVSINELTVMLKINGRNDLSEFDITGSTLYIDRTTAVLKVEKYIIASITASPIGYAVVLLVMHVETFKTDVIGLKVVTS
jgi:hypothetical protein